MAERPEGIKSTPEKNIKNVEVIPKVRFGFYHHHKGRNYLVFGLGRHSESEEVGVVYMPLYSHPGPGFAFRPVKMFLENITVSGVEQPRFRYMGLSWFRDLLVSKVGKGGGGN